MLTYLPPPPPFLEAHIRIQRTPPASGSAAEARARVSAHGLWRTDCAEPNLHLSFADGGGASQRRVIPRAGLLLGRGLHVFDAPFADGRMSLLHAEIRREGGAVVMRPLDGAAETHLNGNQLVSECALEPGDVLRLGDTLFVFTIGAIDDDVGLDRNDSISGFGMAAVRRSVATVARHKHTVVVSGETGTGKEVVAQRIHELSGRSGPFVAVNCAMLSESLLASELFGHVRGAFTGAVSDQQGLFRAANNGTLLLDEMSDMPLPLQASLLRVLETGMVRPVGASRDTLVNTRIIATSNVELIDLVRSAKFRADLYARLSQWTIRVPSLRDRREDIHGLTCSLMRRIDAHRRGVSPDLAEALLVHDWPLNVRGLLHALSIAAIATPVGLPLALHPEVQEALLSSRSMQAEVGRAPILDLDKETIERVMTDCQGRVATVARQIGVSRPRLYRLFATHGIDPDSFRGR